MNVIVKLSLPNYIYAFYRNASAHIQGVSPEKVMADALSAYAGLLSQDIARRREEEDPQSQDNSSRSRSR